MKKIINLLQMPLLIVLVLISTHSLALEAQPSDVDEKSSVELELCRLELSGEEENEGIIAKYVSDDDEPIFIIIKKGPFRYTIELLTRNQILFETDLHFQRALEIKEQGSDFLSIQIESGATGYADYAETIVLLPSKFSFSLNEASKKFEGYKAERSLDYQTDSLHPNKLIEIYKKWKGAAEPGMHTLGEY